jgi:fatty-acid O-methyltransferase
MFLLWKRYLPKGMKQRMMVAWYNAMSRLDRKGEVLFLNHGYVAADSAAIAIPAHLESYRYPIQLYDSLARKADWRGKDALEVSSGMGGGMLWIAGTFAPRRFVGLDIASASTAANRKRFKHLGLEFVTGDAQAMPFADASFDIVLNVESSLNYPDMGKFLSEVVRVLRPGGYFLFADYRKPGRMAAVKAALSAMPLDLVEMEDIASGIIAGLANEEKRKSALIGKLVPGPLRATARRFAGGGETERALFVSGTKQYIRAVLRKPA